MANIFYFLSSLPLLPPATRQCLGHVCLSVELRFGLHDPQKELVKSKSQIPHINFKNGNNKFMGSPLYSSSNLEI
jgi:hypothetical protein